MSKQIQMRRKRGREWPIKNNGEFIILELISAAGAGWLPAGCLAGCLTRNEVWLTPRLTPDFNWPQKEFNWKLKSENRIFQDQSLAPILAHNFGPIFLQLFKHLNLG